MKNDIEKRTYFTLHTELPGLENIIVGPFDVLEAYRINDVPPFYSDEDKHSAIALNIVMTPQFRSLGIEVESVDITDITEDVQYFQDDVQLTLEYYEPSDSMELYNSKTHTYYNRSGSQLRNPSEYKPDPDGIYEPFGDE